MEHAPIKQWLKLKPPSDKAIAKHVYDLIVVVQAFNPTFNLTFI